MRKVKVNLTEYVATEAGLRYCPAVIIQNGRIKQDIVVVNGKEERHLEGAYYLDWRTNGIRVPLSVGKNGQDALTQRDRKTFELNAANHGVVLQSEQYNLRPLFPVGDERPYLAFPLQPRSVCRSALET